MVSDRDSALTGIFDDSEILDETEDEEMDPRRLDKALDPSLWYFRAEGLVAGVVLASLVWYFAT